MKKILSLLLLTHTCWMSSCTAPNLHPQSVRAVALVDVTNRMKILPDADILLFFFDFPNDENSEARLRLTTTTDKLFNPSVELYLPSDSVTEQENHLQDPTFRKKKIIDFYAKTRNAVSTFNAAIQQDTTTIPHSECFRSVAQELASMKEKRCTKNVLFYYSDLAENSDLYSMASLTQALQTPEQIIKRFEATALLPEDLSGYTIFLIYQSETRVADRMFAAMAEHVYKPLLTTRSATVIIRADNPVIP